MFFTYSSTQTFVFFAQVLCTFLHVLANTNILLLRTSCLRILCRPKNLHKFFAHSCTHEHSCKHEPSCSLHEFFAEYSCTQEHSCSFHKFFTHSCTREYSCSLHKFFAHSLQTKTNAQDHSCTRTFCLFAQYCCWMSCVLFAQHCSWIVLFVQCYVCCVYNIPLHARTTLLTGVCVCVCTHTRTQRTIN